MKDRGKEDLVLYLGRRRPAKDLALEDVSIAYAVRLDDTEQVKRAAHFLSKRTKRRPLTKEDIDALLKDVGPELVYEGPESVRQALRDDSDLRQAVGRLGNLLEELAAKRKKGVKTKK